MKFTKLFAAAVLATLTFFTSCEKEEQLGAAAVSVNPVEASLTAEAGATATVNLKATRDWTVTGVPDWLVVEPSSGKGSNSAKPVKLTAKSNPGIDREANITFTIGFSDAVLKVKQAGEAGSASEALIYRNNFDKEEVAKVGTSFPYLDQTECWKNEEGNGIAGVKYEFATMSVRNSGKLSNDATGYSLYAGSGHNKLFFGKQAKFAIKNIALGGKTNLELSFGGQRYSQDDKDNTFNSSEFKVYVSIDGLKGVEVPIEFASGSAPVGNWDLASAKFAVPAGTETLAIVFKIPEVLTNNAYSIDDVQLIASGAATALDFTNAEDLGLDASELIPDDNDVTDLATIVAKASGTDVTVLNATVTAVTTKGYVISDGTTSIYVYKNADPKLAVGDKVSIIGKFQYYWGEYEISGASEKKTGTATPVYPTPNEVNAAFLARTKSTAAVDEASTNYQGMWYPVYAHVSAKVHKDGNYTQFLVDGCTDPISFVSAPSKMFQDATGTEWGEGNEVEILGYYGGWVAPTDDRAGYHQFIAVSVTGKATYTPVEAVVAGDDIFIAANEAHDLGVTNGNAFTNPVTVGDASFSFDGGGNNGKYYNTGSAVRIYNGGSVKISSARPIVKIEYLFAADDKDGTYSPADADLAKLFPEGATYNWDKDKLILTWTGKANEVVLSYPLTSGNYRFQQIGITYGQDVEARLAVSPSEISVKADATSAKFTVQSNVAWTVNSNNNSFVAEPASGNGTAEVTVTFPANESLENAVVAKLTVSANGVDDAVVTITQAKAIDENAVTDIKATCWDAANGTSVELYNVIVSAVSYKNYIVTDGTSAIYVYANSNTHGRKIGEKLNLTGKTSWYNGLLELTGVTVAKVVSEGNEVPYPAPVELTGAVLNSTYASQSNNSPFYAKFTAKVTISGNYVQFTPEGADNYLSLQDLPNSVKETLTEGAEVTVYGYYGGWHSKNNYHLFYYAKHEVVGAAPASLKVDKTAIEVAATATSATINVTSTVDWTATLTSGTAELAGADGTTGSTINGTGNGRVMVGFAANEDTENAKTYTVTLSGEGVENVVVTITQAKAVAQGGGGMANAVLYQETFGTEAVAPFSSYTGKGSSSYNSASTLTYTCKSDNTKIQSDAQGDCDSANLMIGGKNGKAGEWAKISGIKTYGAKKVVVQWAANNGESVVSIEESSTEGKVSEASASNTETFVLSGSEETISLVITARTAKNSRVDSFKIAFVE